MFNIITPQLKALYNEAIDSLIGQNGLAVPCKIIYDSLKRSTCTNCVVDPIQQRSSNKYNGTGPVPFPNMGICPVCAGYGFIDMSAEETVYLAVIFDSKYWFNWGSKVINVQDGMVQTICKIELLPKIRNAQYMSMDTNIQPYGGHSYALAGDPSPCGLGSNKYIITMWSRA